MPRFARGAALTLATTATFAAALGAAVVLHLDTRLARVVAASAVTSVLTKTFLGRVVLETIDHVDANGFSGASARVYDPEGTCVLAVRGLAGRASLVDVARRLLGGGDIDLEIAYARVEHAEVHLIAGADGVPSLARAFVPRPSSGPPTAGPSPRVRVWLPHVEVASAHGSGAILGLSNLDVDLSNVSGSVLAGTERTSIRMKRYGASVRGLTAGALQGTADTRIEIPSSSGKSLSLWAVLDGYMGEVQVNARVGLDGDQFSATADAPFARPVAARALWAPWPVLEDVDLHVSAKGVLPHLMTEGSVRIGDGRARFSGPISFEHGFRADIGVDAQNVRPSAFVEGAPKTKVSTSGKVTMGAPDGEPFTGTIDATTAPFVIQGVEIAGGSIEAKFDGAGAVGKMFVHDEALPSVLEFGVHPDAAKGQVVVDLDWSANARDIGGVPWLASLGHGRAKWHAKGRIVGGELDARFDATAHHLSLPSLVLEQGNLSGSVRGPLDELALDADLRGRDLSLGPLRFPDVRASASGPLSRLTVQTSLSGEVGPKLSGTGTVRTTTQGTRLEAVTIAVSRDNVVLSGSAKSLEIAEDRVELHDVAIEGAGEPIRGSLTLAPSRLSARLSSGHLDLKKLGLVLLPEAKLEGRVAFDVDASFLGKEERGHLRASVEDGSVLGVAGVSLHVEAAVDQRRFTGGASVRVGELGALTVTASDAELFGPMLRASSWQNATGKLQIDATAFLDALKKQVPLVFGPLLEVGGALRTKVLLSREDIEAHRKHAQAAQGAPSPDIDAIVWTDGLRFEMGDRKSVVDVHPLPSFSTQGVDVQLGLHVDAEDPAAQLTARLIDGEGIFVGVTAIARTSTEELMAARGKLAEKLAGLPLQATFTVPRRALDLFPAFARPAGFVGEVEATGVLGGSLRAPVVSAKVRGHGVQPADAALALPVDVDAEATYDGKKARARVRASRPEGVVLDGMTEIEAVLADVVGPNGSGSANPWQASGSAELFRFPLASIPALAESQVAGSASGKLSFTGLGRDPEVLGQIELRDVMVERAAFPQGQVHLRVAKNGIVASAKLDQADGGGASATASARLEWPSPVVPAIDHGAPVDLYLDARAFRAAALYPLLFRGVFTYFDGDLRGTLHLHEEKRNEAVKQTVEGAFELKDGIFQIPEIGQEFRKATAQIRVAEGGQVEVSDVAASGVTGRLTASGSMQLKGFSFVSGEGTLRVAEKEAVPLTLEGVSVGDAFGTLMLHAKMDGDHTVKVDVDVPVFHTDIPESSSRDVQALADHDGIRVGIGDGEGKLVPVALGVPQAKRADDALSWHLTFYLGQDVKLTRGQTMRMVLGGQPVVDLTDEARVSGSVEFRSGAVEVFGKTFEIEHGVARFEGDDPGNPYVNVTARWDGPDATRIFVDYVGPLRTGVLGLRSEPARSRADILAILLFGTAETASPAAGFTTQTRGTANAGTALALGQVSTGVNQVLSNVVPSKLTTRVSSDARGPTPEVAYQLSPKVTAQLSFRTRKPTLNELPDRILLTLDWRFRRNWSVTVTRGDAGRSVLDLIWQYRY